MTMIQRIGKCTNYSGCKLAYRNEKCTVVTKEFRCPECGLPLESVDSKKEAPFMLYAVGGTVAVLLLAVALCHPTEHSFAALPFVGFLWGSQPNGAQETSTGLSAASRPPLVAPSKPAANPTPPPAASAPSVELATGNTPAPMPASSTASSASPPDLGYPGECYPATRQRLIKWGEVAVLTPAQLTYAIQEVYARHGEIFPFYPQIQAQFSRFHWYKPRPELTDTQINTSLSQCERYNVQLLQRALSAASSGNQPGVAYAYAGERYPQTRQRLIKPDEAAVLTPAQLCYAIDEVYARHGAIFPQDPQIEAQFRQLPWYKPRPELTAAQIKASFSQIEQHNVELLESSVHDRAPAETCPGKYTPSAALVHNRL
jgi:YARHG domain